MTERVAIMSEPLVGKLELVEVSSLMDISNREPFVSGSNLSVVMDLDGVSCGRDEDNTFEINVKKLDALKEIARKSREIMFYSSRKPMDEDCFIWKKIFGPAFERQSITTFPFLTEKSASRLSNYIRSCNPNCNTIFNLDGEFPEEKRKRIEEKKKRQNALKLQTEGGIYDDKEDKKDQSKEFYDFCARALRQDRRLVVIGSNVFDRKEAQQMVRVMELKGYDKDHIFCFNTGHFLV